MYALFGIKSISCRFLKGLQLWLLALSLMVRLLHPEDSPLRWSPTIPHAESLTLPDEGKDENEGDLEDEVEDVAGGDRVIMLSSCTESLTLLDKGEGMGELEDEVESVVRED